MLRNSNHTSTFHLQLDGTLVCLNRTSYNECVPVLLDHSVTMCKYLITNTNMPTKQTIEISWRALQIENKHKKEKERM